MRQSINQKHVFSRTSTCPIFDAKLSTCQASPLRYPCNITTFLRMHLKSMPPFPRHATQAPILPMPLLLLQLSLPSNLPPAVTPTTHGRSTDCEKRRTESTSPPHLEKTGKNGCACPCLNPENLPKWKILSPRWWQPLDVKSSEAPARG